MLLCIVSETKLVSNKELVLLSQAMQKSADDCASAWGLPSPGIIAIDDFTQLESQLTCHPIFLTESNGTEDSLGYHYWDRLRRGPASRVFVDAASGMNSGDYSLCETLSHEVVEAIVDPKVDQWRPWIGHPGYEMALEIADPTQEWYGFHQNGDIWRLANFVLPFYFEKKGMFQAGQSRVDFLGELSVPGEIGRKGYAIVRKNGKNEAVYGPQFSLSPTALKNKRHNLGRSFQRGVWMAALDVPTAFPDEITKVERPSRLPPSE